MMTERSEKMPAQAGMINKIQRVPFEFFAILWQVSLASPSPPFGGELFVL
jgi:hypothetical protein